jgi:GT2 family glycosyltransferase
MIGVLNVLYNNDEDEMAQFYRELQKTLAQSGPDHEILILDNSGASQRHAVPGHAKYTRPGLNIGYTRACNLLIARAFEEGCDAVVTMNVDGFPLPGCVANMVATLDRNGGDALVEARQFPKEHPRYYDPVSGATDWVSGCCLLIPRTTHDRLGPLDEGMFLYCEDVDYSFRARAVGIPCVVSTNAFFYHRGSTGPTEPSRRRNQLLSARYLATKWRNPDALKIAEDALVKEGFFASIQDMPKLAQGLQAPPGITWDAANRLTFAWARWGN